jgi:hypothetical protein
MALTWKFIEDSSSELSSPSSSILMRFLEQIHLIFYLKNYLNWCIMTAPIEEDERNDLS